MQIGLKRSVCRRELPKRPNFMGMIGCNHTIWGKIGHIIFNQNCIRRSRGTAIALWHDARHRERVAGFRLWRIFRTILVFGFNGAVRRIVSLGCLRHRGHHRRHRDARHRHGLAEALALVKLAFEIAHLALTVGACARAVARMRAFAIGQRDAVGVGDLPPHLLQDLACGMPRDIVQELESAKIHFFHCGNFAERRKCAET